MTARQAFEKGKEILKAGGVEAYAFDAACLFEYFCKMTRMDIILGQKQPQNVDAFFDACEREARGEPLQYILGTWEFYGVELDVIPGVLIPRSDTEQLVAYAEAFAPCGARVLDICCGSGCIGIALKKSRPDLDITLADISDAALETSRKNAKKNGADVRIMKADLFCGSREYFADESFDILISNPPYISKADMQKLSKWVKNEPELALYGGEDGTDCYFALINGWKSVLSPGGQMILETGYDTYEAVTAMFTELEYTDVVTRKDFGGVTRLAAAKREQKIL